MKNVMYFIDLHGIPVLLIKQDHLETIPVFNQINFDELIIKSHSDIDTPIRRIHQKSFQASDVSPAE